MVRFDFVQTYAGSHGAVGAQAIEYMLPLKKRLPILHQWALPKDVDTDVRAVARKKRISMVTTFEMLIVGASKLGASMTPETRAFFAKVKDEMVVLSDTLSEQDLPRDFFRLVWSSEKSAIVLTFNYSSTEFVQFLVNRMARATRDVLHKARAK